MIDATFKVKCCGEWNYSYVMPIRCKKCKKLHGKKR